ncbi:Kar3p [Sugiyamaella lignohabitans]|uniref:Kar3p n=1 Tax=Sugiyamaella lignohabitans TaxID=796027 RepID=A0A167F772_9ASCO|nr:Kar3p [Sugiyamaella lignohabitans]ANB14899.1 Kar3p [Sugiyamaella lignohabitans]
MSCGSRSQEDLGDNEKYLPVYLRLKPRPANHVQDPFLSLVPGSPQVVVDPPKNSRYKVQEAFSFNGIFKESSGQIDVYKSAVLPLVQTVLKNHNDALLFSMGASGSGKTHTILGYKQTPGMIHFALDTIFKSIHSKIAEFETAEAISDMNSSKSGTSRTRTSQAIEAGIMLDWSNESKSNNHVSPNNLLLNGFSLDDKIDVSDKYSYAMYISMVEIYNDRIFDLYGDANKRGALGRRPALLIKTDPETGKSYLTDVRKVYVADKEEAFKTIEHGLSLRAAHSTGSNQSSSRSHAFIIIEIKRINKVDSSISSSTLTIADLAGSERVKASRTQGNRLVESCAINKSLMLLGQCLQKQRGSGNNNPADIAALRSSKLTQLLLSNAFNPKLHQRSALLVTIDHYGDYNQASQILRYSALAREVSVPQTRIPSLRSVSNSSSSSAHSNESTTLTEGSDDDQEEHLLLRVKELEAALAESQAALAASEEHALLIEQQVREEMADEMESYIDKLTSRFYDRLDDEIDRNQNYTDSKLEIMQALLSRDIPKYREMEAEIAHLRQENMFLREQL